jgi:Fic family protein
MHVATPPNLDNLINDLSNSNRLVLALEAPPPPGYPHWDKVRHLTPPEGLKPEEWWWGIKWSRRQIGRGLPLRMIDGRPFTYGLPDDVLRMLHYVDQRCSGEIAMAEVVTADDQARQHYLVNSLMEEAIRSSQLEGASTTRAVAKELLRSGRAPRDRSETMIRNNYAALQFMREEVDTLTPEVVLELQRILTDGTIDPSFAGRLQVPNDERVAVFDLSTGELIHKPPPAEELPERLRAMCAFANEAEDPNDFMHPVVRAILLHFWLAYDHPFEDGNGRTARALFYWSMRTQGYWLTEYLSVSSILAKAPSKYVRAFLLTETDEGDTIYFLLYQLSVIQRAIDQLHSYLRRKAKEVAEVEKAIKLHADFNHRQLALLGDAIRNQGHTYTFQSHATSHNVTHETSRRDLMHLHELGLLERRRVGRRHVFSPMSDLAQRLKRAA